MGNVIPLKKEAKNSYFELKNYFEKEIEKVDNRIFHKLDSDVKLVQKLTDHHFSSKGKKIRALLTLGSAKLCSSVIDDRSINLAACVELIHNATLMHDDVVDNGQIRRGIKTTNKIWGNHSSILVGDYLLSRCFEMMVEDGSIEILKLLSSTSSKIAQGEVLQLEHEGEVDLLEDIYFQIINWKTASLFAASTRVGACIANKSRKEKDALEAYGRNLGIAFQIADDALDYYSEENVFGKKIGKDFFEGKVTLPVILLYEKSNENERALLKSIFKKIKRTHEDLKLVISLMKKYKSIDECFKRGEHFSNVSFDALKIFRPSAEKNILQNIVSFCINRNY
mgnify:FL=1|tara:strand:+ start:4842 stop:5855 length:1014 start_codon:yes stop_codon:yes gene_type:complete